MGLVNIEGLKQNGCELWFTGETVSANTPKVVTTVGKVMQYPSPFDGAGIINLDGIGDYLTFSTSDIDFSSSTWTIEGWVFTTTYADYIRFYVNGPNSSGSTYTCIGIQKTTGYAIFDLYNTSSIGRIISTTPVYTNAWNHIVAQRNGSELFLALNGISCGIATLSGTPFVSTINSIGRNGDSANQYLQGGMSEFRISNVARYTSAAAGTVCFVPPRYRFTSDANTLLLLHFDESDAQNIVDSSASPKTITSYGLPIQITPSLHNGVGYFTNNTTYLSIPDSADMELGTNNFTIRMKVMLNATSIRNGLFCKRDSSISTYGPVWVEVFSTNKIMLSLSSNGTSFDICDSLQGDTTFVTNRWYDIEFTRSGSTFRLFVDGNLELIVNSSASLIDNSYPWLIGTAATNVGFLNGCISEFVFINGYALHTTNFTPTTAPFAPDSYTKLLLRMDGVGLNFHDSATRSGDNGFPILPGVALSTVGSFTSLRTKSGKYVLHKATGSNYISIGNHAAWNMSTTVPYAILFWLKCTTTGVLLGRSTGSSGYSYESWMIDFNSGKLRMRLESNAATPFDVIIESTTVLNDGIWRHAAIVFTGSAYKIYINSQLESTVVSSVGSFPQSCVMGIFAVYNAQTPVWVASAFVGEIADLMMFKRKVITQDKIAAIMNETFIY